MEMKLDSCLLHRGCYEKKVKVDDKQRNKLVRAAECCRRNRKVRQRDGLRLRVTGQDEKGQSR